MASFGHPPAPVLGFSMGCGLASAAPSSHLQVTILLAGAPACPVRQRCPGHLPAQAHGSGCYQVFQAMAVR